MENNSTQTVSASRIKGLGKFTFFGILWFALEQGAKNNRKSKVFIVENVFSRGEIIQYLPGGKLITLGNFQ